MKKLIIDSNCIAYQAFYSIPKDLSTEDLLTCEDHEVRKIELNVPGCQGNFYVRTISADEKDKLELSITNGTRHIRARYVALGVCDKDGKRLFGDDQMIEISKKSLRLVQKMFQAVCDVNSATDEDIEQIAKNS